MITRQAYRLALVVCGGTSAALGQPDLPDFGAATFDANSSISTHPYFPLIPGTVDIDFGFFEDVLNTAEGNLLDGPEITEHKLYARGVGLTLVQELDDEGNPEFEIEILAQVPAPGAAVLAGSALFPGRRRPKQLLRRSVSP